MEKGIKYDEGKNRWDLLPFEVLDEMAKVWTAGSKKYADHNWRGGLSYSRLVAAAFRHFKAWWSGEKVDPETNCFHLAAMLFNISVLLSQELRGMDALDDCTAARVMPERSEGSSASIDAPEPASQE